MISRASISWNAKMRRTIFFSSSESIPARSTPPMHCSSSLRRGRAEKRSGGRPSIFKARFISAWDPVERGLRTAPIVRMRGIRLRPIFSPASCAHAEGMRLPGKAMSTVEATRAMMKTYGGSERSWMREATSRASATQEIRLITRNDQMICWECVIQYSTPAAALPPPCLIFQRRSIDIPWSAALPRVQKKTTDRNAAAESQVSIRPLSFTRPGSRAGRAAA